MAESLQEQHPDIVKVVRKFGRWHHSVDYRGFQTNKLMKVDPFAPEMVSDYGLEQETAIADSFMFAQTSRLVQVRA